MFVHHTTSPAATEATALEEGKPLNPQKERRKSINLQKEEQRLIIKQKSHTEKFSKVSDTRYSLRNLDRQFP